MESTRVEKRFVPPVSHRRVLVSYIGIEREQSVLCDYIFKFYLFYGLELGADS